MSTLPKKPTFSENTSSPATVAKTEKSPEATTDSNVADFQPETEKDPLLKSESESESELPPNAYRAVVTWPQGLSLRSQPDLNAGKVGGISHNAKIIILEDSADGQWQKVRLPWSQEEGWVKAGNTERASY